MLTALCVVGAARFGPASLSMQTEKISHESGYCGNSWLLCVCVLLWSEVSRVACTFGLQVMNKDDSSRTHSPGVTDAGPRLGHDEGGEGPCIASNWNNQDI